MGDTLKWSGAVCMVMKLIMVVIVTCVCPDGDGLVKYEHCNTDIGCPFWSSWNDWSECLRDEHDTAIGHRRFRFCIDPQHPDEHLPTGQPECREHDNEELVPCYDTECPV